MLTKTKNSKNVSVDFEIGKTEMGRHPFGNRPIFLRKMRGVDAEHHRYTRQASQRTLD